MVLTLGTAQVKEILLEHLLLSINLFFLGSLADRGEGSCTAL